MRSLYTAHRTWLHDVPAWFKLLALSIIGTALMLIGTLKPLISAAALGLALLLSLGPGAWRQWRILRGLLIASVLIAVFHWLTDDWARGLISALRLMTVAMLALMLSVTTRFDDLLAVLETILSPLRHCGVPVQRIALSIGLTLRFAENFYAQWQRLDDAHRVRSGRGGGLRLLAPLAIRALQTAERVADALAARLGS